MCTGKCSRVVGVGLWPLALTCIVCNLILCFPAWDLQYVQQRDQLTPEVLYLGGLVGGGLLILIPAIHIQATGRQGCCGNRCGMFLSILFALLGVVGSVYAVSVASLGLVNGPLCQVRKSNGSLGAWEQPFRSLDLEQLRERSYLFNTSTWDTCVKPPGVVQFNVILFSLGLGAALLELLLCAAQVLNGLFGCLCGTCNRRQDRSAKETRY
ncbi:transmembrane 4 L6 family member 5-like isoform X1 [Pelodiscus sinensis]|uniref:transmembrane 4 L6 family member 5-like isoform X1 n=1 Tax=Pelodiscus sinensis TaxID=13735 RepID=UPI0003C48F5F|nr:transmembrane 4 L6 family member 5-like isoform X1 [Pelodiscus sinensis]|eukprot:XP_006127326.1 transmembrane 4 L6 family member 5-like isoform X1 [Pelodiscus sinensis]